MDKPDPTLTELKRLREGAGLTIERLNSSPAVLSSLATSDPKEAFDALAAILTRIPDSDQLRALVVDLGFDLDELFKRKATPKERALLGERRSGYAETIGRDVKTLARWSNKALDELRGHLLNDFFDGNIVIGAGVQNRRLINISVMRFEKTDDGYNSGRTEGRSNPEKGSSLPMVLYGYPRDWKPATIQFVVTFIGERPTIAWALAADTILDVGFGHQRYAIDIDDNMARCRIDNPRRDQLYGVWWEW